MAISLQREAAGGGEVCAWRAVGVWRGIMNWLGFLLELFLQILKGTPSFAQMLLSYLAQPRFLSSSSSSSPAFKPLPTVEIPLQDTSISSPPSSAAANLVPRSDSAADGAGSGGGDRDLPLQKLTVVLDLDETLVSAYETSSLPVSVRTKAIESGLKWFELEFVSSDKECEGKSTINYVTVFERPGLQEFLKQIGEFANLVLFTAGLEGYARPLVDRIDADGRFSLRLYRPSTVSTPHQQFLEAFYHCVNPREYREHVKDLSCLSKDLCRIVIVDNNPFSFLLQPLNGIPCSPFSASQPNDDQLLQVLLPLLRYLSLQKDVRPVLYDRFHMPEWFEMHGIPASRFAREN